MNGVIVGVTTKSQSRALLRGNGGVMLVEVLIATMIIVIVSLALYAGFSLGFAEIKAARENLRATQIMAEKTETIRLYRWDQINSNGFVPTNFTAYFNTQSGSTNGIACSGTVTISTPALDPSPPYATNMRLITIKIEWPSGQTIRRREMSTLVSQYGMQNYIY